MVLLQRIAMIEIDFMQLERERSYEYGSPEYHQQNLVRFYLRFFDFVV